MISKGIKLKKQKGMFDEDCAIFFLFAFLLAFVFLIASNESELKEEALANKKSLQSKGYSLVRDFGDSDDSDKSLPSSDLLSNCVEEEYIFVNKMYIKTEELAEAKGIMCQLKK